MRGMIIKNNIVKNVAVFDSEADLFDGWVVAPDGVGIDYIDNGDGTFTEPDQE